MPVTVDSTNDKKQEHAAGQANLAAPPVSAAATPKSNFFALGQALCYLLVCIAVMEASFYLACVGDGEHVYPDLKVGYKIFAGKRITQRNEGFGCFKLNSFGMQNDETTIAKPAGTYRIAVFGDSYVEALQVPRQANYLNEVGETLSKRLGRPVEVLNFGVSNYSVAQDYLRYQTLAKQFKPDMVFVPLLRDAVFCLAAATASRRRR